MYNDEPTATVDLASLSDEDLAQLCLHENDWYVRHARLQLHMRAVAGRLDTRAVHSKLNELGVEALIEEAQASP